MGQQLGLAVGIQVRGQARQPVQQEGLGADDRRRAEGAQRQHARIQARFQHVVDRAEDGVGDVVEERGVLDRGGIRGHHGVLGGEGGALVVTGVGAGAGIAVEVPVGEEPGDHAAHGDSGAHEHALAALLVGHLVQHDLVLVADHPLHAHHVQDRQVRGGSEAREDPALEGFAVEVVVDSVQVVPAGQRRVETEGLVQAGAAPGHGPEFHGAVQGLGRAHRIGRDAIGIHRAAVEALLLHHDRVGGRGLGRAAGGPVAQETGAVTGVGVGGRAGGQRQPEADIGDHDAVALGDRLFLAIGGHRHRRRVLGPGRGRSQQPARDHRRHQPVPNNLPRRMFHPEDVATACALGHWAICQLPPPALVQVAKRGRLGR
ncbi:hypothetical protein [Nocardia sp. NPDC048505]|uniref:hypothetical protein n=1 Tax=unclassified Nocardia TaxID=2637762 RepID=UPI0033E6A503